MLNLSNVDDGLAESGVQAGLFLYAIPDGFAEGFQRKRPELENRQNHSPELSRTPSV